MNKYLYSDENICNLTKQLITLLEIPISKNDDRTTQIIKKCHQIVGNTQPMGQSSVANRTQQLRSTSGRYSF